MGEYTKRTCHKCGYRDIQPNMVQKEIEYTSGSSNTGITGRSLIAAGFGDKKAQAQNRKYLFSPSKRVYKRRRKVWLCPDCAGVKHQSTAENLKEIGMLILRQIVGFLILVFLIWVVIMTVDG